MRAVVPFVVAVVLLVTRAAFAAFVPPPIQGYVTDSAGKLSQEEIQALDTKLAAYRTCSHDQIAVFVARSLEGDTIENVGHATATAWQLGERGKDNGVLLVLAPNERKVRIEVGRGLEGRLTDLQSNDVLREHVSPNLKKDDFFAAIDEGTNGIAKALWSTGDHAACAAIAGATRPPSSGLKPPPATSQPPGSSEGHGFGVLLTISLAGFFVALAALTFTRMGGGIGSLIGGLLFSCFFGAIGSCVVTANASGLGDKGRAITAVVAALFIVGVRVLLARRKARPSGASYASTASDGGSSSSSSFDAGSSFGSSTSDSSSSSSSSSSSDTSFTGGGGGTFGGGGSSDSY